MSRYRNLAVLVVVIAAQLVLLAYQVRSHEDVSLLRSATVTAVTPLARLLDGFRDNTMGFFQKYFYLMHVQQENKRLKDELDRLKLETQYLRTELTTADRVRALAMFQEQTRSKTVAARIIGTGTGSNSRAVFVDRGQKDGVQRGMAVITPDGIVGKVIFVYPAASQVLLITDQTFAAGVISQKNRVPGTLKGVGRNMVLVDYIQNEVKVEEGEWFFTSGDDRVFPKGLPAGQVRLRKPGKTFQEIYVDPSGLEQGLQEVLIVLEGVHESIPEGDNGPAMASGPVMILPPPSAGGAKAGEPPTSYLNTDADRVRDRMRRIEEVQGVKLGSAGARLPNFNMDPSQAPKPPATGGAASGTASGSPQASTAPPAGSPGADRAKPRPATPVKPPAADPSAPPRSGAAVPATVLSPPPVKAQN